MKYQTVESIDELILLAESRGLKKGVRILRNAQADIISASKGPFSAKEKKVLGPIASLMEEEAESFSSALGDELVSLLVKRAETATKKLHKRIRSEYGASGVSKAEEFSKRWYLDLVERVVHDKLNTELENQLDVEEENSDEDEDEDEDADEDAEETDPKTAITRNPARNSRRASREVREVAKTWRTKGLSAQAERLDRVADHVASR